MSRLTGVLVAVVLMQGCVTPEVGASNSYREEPTGVTSFESPGGGPTEGGVGGCCKYCTEGKPCGDSCIAIDKTCHKGPGCAC